MLLVIASLPPKQLQKLESFLNGVTSEGSDLSWADYCGYEEIKIKLKRLLRSTKNEILPKENQYKPKTSNFDSDSDLNSNSSTNIIQHPDSSDKSNGENSDDEKRSDVLLKNSTDNTTEGNKFQTSSRSLSTLNQDQQQKQNQKQEQKQKIKFQSMHGRVRGIVIHGPSGCGKSFLAKIFAAEVRLFRPWTLDSRVDLSYFIDYN